MAFCTSCGANNPDGAITCSRCGAPLEANVQRGAYQQPTPQPPINYGMPSRPAPIPTGGIIAWAIITLLLCTIPGIVALVKATGINNSLTVEEQQQKLQSAKTWCIVGTVLGVLGSVLYIVIMAAAGSASYY